MTDEIRFEYVETNGIRLRVAVQGQGPLVLFVHGFPESWYSWRHQMKPVAQAGFTAAAVDVTAAKTNTAKMRFNKCMGGLWGTGEIFQSRKCAAGST